MAESCGAIREELKIEDLKREMKVTDRQLDSVVEEADLPELAACFDNTEDYIEKLGLSPGQQNDVKTKFYQHGTQAGMKEALKHWRNNHPIAATFRKLILILLSILKGNVAVRVCMYLSGIRGSELCTEDLKRKTKVTDGQLDSVVEEADLPELAACFDNTEDYVEKFGLSPGQQTDVKTKTLVHGVQAGIKDALKHWRNKNPYLATFKALILILLLLSKGSVAVEVCRYLYDKCSPSHLSRVRILVGPKESYRDYLRSCYRAQGLTPSSQWPPVPTTKVFKLAVILKEKIQRGKIDEDLVRMSITGKVDDILLKKTPIELYNILCKAEYGRKFTLVEGAPGCGKNTLALFICQEWTEDRLFQEYDIVVLVRLRDPCIRHAKTIADLLPRVDKAMADEMEAVMKSTFGRGVLWVLDGFDELPFDLPTDSVINKLIQPGISQESPLPECALIITSRPSSSAELHPLVSSRVEVLGFTPDEVEQYFTECLDGDTNAVQTLLERIRENPVVEGSCYLPLNASIVAHTFISGDHTLPTSNHGVFMSLVQCTLKRYLKDKLGRATPVGDITSPDSLPPEIRVPFVCFCELAFYGIEKNKVTFSKSDLSAISISMDIADLDLLQSCPSIIGDDHEVYFSFLHLSIQELLAALHISWMSSKQQISVFQNLFDNPRFSAVFQFYTGISKLRTKRSFLSRLPRFLCPVPASVYDLLREIVKHGSKHLFAVFNCLYEAEDPSLCVFVANVLNHCLNIEDITLSPLDCLSLGYFLSVTSCEHFELGLERSCPISRHGCKFLIKGIQKHQAAESSLQLRINNSVDQVCFVVKLLQHTDIIASLHICAHMTHWSDSAVTQRLCKALSVKTTVKKLAFQGWSLTTADGPSLCHLLSVNKSLKSLSISVNTLTGCCSDIAAGLINNCTLKELRMAACHLTDQCLKELCTGLNNCLETLNIGVNPSLTDNGLVVLVRHLATHCRLQCLIVPRGINISSVRKQVLSDFHEDDKAKKNLPWISYTGSKLSDPLVKFVSKTDFT